jgi:RNA polymerase sigma-70 factor (ECF subfamily)
MTARFELTGPSDADLVRASLGGDRAAFADLFSRHRALLASLVGRMLEDQVLAEDAIQETAVTALTSLDRLQDADRFGPWLAGIGLNLCRRWLRQRSRREWSWETLQGGLRGDDQEEWIDPAEAAVEADLAAAVRAAVADLPPGQRQAVVLFYFAGLRHREVADALGIKVGAVKARLHQARTALREQLDGTWRSFTMADETPDGFVPMHPRDVYRVAGGGDAPEAYSIVLAEPDGPRILTIWMGGNEAVWLAHVMEGVETSRPGPYALMERLLGESGLTLGEVRISKLADEVFHAELVLQAGGRLVSIDARPSDALNLALRLGTPVMVSEQVLAMIQRSIDRNPARRAVSRDRVMADATTIVAEAKGRQDALAAAIARWDYGQERT